MSDVPTLTIEIASDLVCPWCFVGKRRLDRAIERVAPRVTVKTRWLPFQLDPSVPRAGVDYKDNLVRKFGSAKRIEDAWARLTELGREDGIAFRFDAQKVMPHTITGHRLVAHAQSLDDASLTDRLVEGLFRAHFCDGRDTGNLDVLVDVAADAGLEREATRAMLLGDAHAAEVADEIAEVRALGISSVPTFIVDRRFGVAGAQPVETLEAVITRALQES